MTRYDRRSRALAVSLAALAGYVDAIGFIASGGMFVSFMSGNSTRLAVGIGERSAQVAALAALIAVFVSGVVAGSVLGHATRDNRRFSILSLMAAVLSLAAISGQSGHLWLTIACLAFAMGAANAIFEQDGQVGLGVTYMTGSLVRIGHGLAGWLVGQRRTGWVPYLILWLGLSTGAVLGALAYTGLHMISIWLASAAAAILAIAAWLMTPGN